MMKKYLDRQRLVHNNAHLYYLGHSSFEWITSSGRRIIIDPYGNPVKGHWFNHPFPKLEADLVLVTHSHFDHNAISRIKGNPQTFAKVGVKYAKDYIVQCFAGHHARAKFYGFTENRICIIEVNQVLFCHWGDNSAEVGDNLSHLLGRIDVLMLPVDESEHLLTISEDKEIIEWLSPKVVIPMHYFYPGLTSIYSTLKPINHWIEQQPRVRKISASGIPISPNILPQKQEIWVFERYMPKLNSE